MEEGIKENGLITKNMEKEFSLGQITDDMRVIIVMIRNMVKEHILGPMAECILVSGNMIRGMD